MGDCDHDYVWKRDHFLCTRCGQTAYGKSKARKRRRKAGAAVIAVVAILLVGVFAYQGDISVNTAREVIEDVREGASDAASEIQDGIEDLEPSGSSDRDAPVPVSQDRADNKVEPGQRTTEPDNIISGILQRPVPEEEKPNIEDLYLYALEIVNEDRARHGVKPVQLGHLNSAQAHADDMLEVGYYSHWDSSNLKPYSAYTKMGGIGHVGENIAATHMYCPTYSCVSSSFDAREEIQGMQYAMMYDDAHADWGHRDNIIDPDHTHVNFGLAYDDDNLYFVQHFESNVIEWSVVGISGGILVLDGRLAPGYESDGSAYIFEDPASRKISASVLNDQPPYSWGYYEFGDVVGAVVEDPGSNRFYEECRIGAITLTNDDGSEDCVAYVEYLEYAETSGRFYAKVDMSKWLDRDGLHTLGIFVKNTGTNTVVLAATITLEYL